MPVVNIGTRQTGRLRGSNVIDVEPDTTKILRAIRKQVRKGRYHSDDLYGDGYSGIRVAEAIFSFLENVLHDNSRGSNTGQSTQVLELDRFVA